jgi:hypothetical protein
MPISRQRQTTFTTQLSISNESITPQYESFDRSIKISRTRLTYGLRRTTDRYDITGTPQPIITRSACWSQSDIAELPSPYYFSPVVRYVCMQYWGVHRAFAVDESE